MSRGFGVLLVALVAVVAGAAYAGGFAAGRTPPTHTVPAMDAALAAPGQAQPAQMPPALREFIPLPAPGDQNPGQRPQPQQGECDPIILFYHNGQLYQLLPGPQDQQGPPGVPPEFYRLQPYQGPPVPGLPLPRQDQTPGFVPVNPRS